VMAEAPPTVTVAGSAAIVQVEALPPNLIEAVPVLPEDEIEIVAVLPDVPVLPAAMVTALAR